MKVMIEVNGEVWNEFVAICYEEETSVSAEIEELLKDFIDAYAHMKGHADAVLRSMEERG